jgi:hypothetical protein
LRERRSAVPIVEVAGRWLRNYTPRAKKIAGHSALGSRLQKRVAVEHHTVTANLSKKGDPGHFTDPAPC